MKAKGSKPPLNTFQEQCSECLKPSKLCICAHIKPINTKTRLLILQHPQEPDKLLGTAHLAHQMIVNSSLKIGLSWPNLIKLVGHDSDKTSWIVLYLGNTKTSEVIKEKSKSNQIGSLVIVDKKGHAVPNQLEAINKVKGVIVLDGTWSQAKALWWRNPWLTKLRRAVIIPSKRSLYGKLRKEPRYESLSTIESIGITFSILEDNESFFENLVIPFKELLNKYKELS